MTRGSPMTQETPISGSDLLEVSTMDKKKMKNGQKYG